MRDLVKDTALDEPIKNATRPLPQGHISSGRPVSPSSEHPSSRDRSRERLRTAPIRSLNLRDKWRKTAYTAVKRARNDRAVIEAVQQEIRCLRMKKKRERRAENAERDRNIFDTIFTMIEQMDTKLLRIVDDVRRQKSQDVMLYRVGQQGYLPTERLRTEPRRMPLTTEDGDLRTDGTEASGTVNSASQLSRARMLRVDGMIPASVQITGSLPESQTYQAQNIVFQPISAVLSSRFAPNPQPEQPANGVLRTPEIRVSQDSATAHNLSPSTTASAPQFQQANGHDTTHQGINSVKPTPFRHGTSTELILKRSLYSRFANGVQSAFPNWWFSRYYVPWNWLRRREEALKLRAERDAQWNRVNASQLALITR